MRGQRREEIGGGEQGERDRGEEGKRVRDPRKLGAGLRAERS